MLLKPPQFTFVPNPLDTVYATRSTVVDCQKGGREVGANSQFNPSGIVTSDKDLYTSPAYTCTVCILGQKRGPSTMMHFSPDDPNNPFSPQNGNFLNIELPKQVALFIADSRRKHRQDIFLIGGIDPKTPGLSPERAKGTQTLFEQFKHGINEGMRLAGRRIPLSILWGQQNKDWGTEILYRPTQNKVYLACLPYYSCTDRPPISQEGSLKKLKETFSTVSLPVGSHVISLSTHCDTPKATIKTRFPRSRFQIRPRRKSLSLSLPC